MTQQEIAFKVGVNQGRVNEVIKHGKWLDGDPKSAEAQARDKAVARIKAGPKTIVPGRKPKPRADRHPPQSILVGKAKPTSGQLTFL